MPNTKPNGVAYLDPQYDEVSFLSGGLGYDPTLRSSVTQLTSKTTPVTVPYSMVMTVTTTNASLPAYPSGVAGFQIINPAIEATDLAFAMLVAGGTPDSYGWAVTLIQNGSLTLRMRNISAAPLAEPLTFRIILFKSFDTAAKPRNSNSAGINYSDPKLDSLSATLGGIKFGQTANLVQTGGITSTVGTGTLASHIVITQSAPVTINTGETFGFFLNSPKITANSMIMVMTTGVPVGDFEISGKCSQCTTGGCRIELTNPGASLTASFSIRVIIFN